MKADNDFGTSYPTVTSRSHIADADWDRSSNEMPWRRSTLYKRHAPHTEEFIDKGIMIQADEPSFQVFQGDTLRPPAVYAQDVEGYPISLLTTKLFRPPIGPDIEPRSALLERLQRNQQRPLTIISAPAGYGKSTLASMWLEACGRPSAWISLDEDDNDLSTFTSYLVAAIHAFFQMSH
ncbi:MAG: hypothetical protein R2844_15545 [Caldilineales bacterium]